MPYVKAPDKKIQKISNLLIKYAEMQGVSFCLGDSEVYPVEVFSFFGGLSLFLVEAKDTYEKLYNNLYSVEELMTSFGKKIKELNLEQALEEETFINSRKKTKFFPIELHQTEKIEDEDSTYFGFIPRLSENKTEFYVLAHFSLFAVEEYIKEYKNKPVLMVDGKIPLDPLYEKLVKKLNSREISVVPRSLLINAINKSSN